MTFRSCDLVPVDLAHDVGVVIGATDADRQLMHTGLLYRNSEGDQRFLHLAFHCDLRNEPVPVKQKYFWSDCRWLGRPDYELVRSAVRLFVESVGQEKDIPYGFDASGVRFNGGGQYVSLDPAAGLTCATFIASVFESAGLPVVDLSTWESRPEDEEWRAILVAVIERVDADRARLVAQSALHFRLRPDEIAAASSGDSVPVVFEEAVAAARPVRDIIFAYGRGR